MKKFLRSLMVMVMAVAMSICFVGCGDNGNNSNDSSNSNSGSNSNNSTQSKTYSVGDTVTMKNSDGTDKLKVTINSVSLTTDRNQYTDKNPAQVVIIDYTYENVGSDSDIYYSSSCIKVTDEKGNLCDTYPLSLNKYPDSTPKGSKCTAKQAYGTVEESSKIKIALKDSILDTNSSDDPIFEVNIK